MGNRWGNSGNSVRLFWGAPKSVQMVTAAIRDDPERWYGVGGGRGVQDWEFMYTRGRFMSMYGKTNTVL